MIFILYIPPSVQAPWVLLGLPIPLHLPLLLPILGGDLLLLQSPLEDHLVSLELVPCTCLPSESGSLSLFPWERGWWILISLTLPSRVKFISKDCIQSLFSSVESHCTHVRTIIIYVNFDGVLLHGSLVLQLQQAAVWRLRTWQSRWISSMVDWGSPT